MQKTLRGRLTKGKFQKFPKSRKILERFVRSQEPNGKFRRKTLVDGGCEEIVMSKRVCAKNRSKGRKDQS